MHLIGYAEAAAASDEDDTGEVDEIIKHCNNNKVVICSIVYFFAIYQELERKTCLNLFVADLLMVQSRLRNNCLPCFPHQVHQVHKVH